MSNSQKTQNKVSYFNTLIFTIIGGIVSLLLLVLLYFKGMNDYIPFIVTLEVGIFGIILICIIKIVAAANNLTLIAQNYGLTFDKCPDYYTKRNNGTQDICNNDYLYTDVNGTQWILKVYPEDDPTISGGMIPLPATVNFNYNGGEPKYEKFPLNEIANTASLYTDAEKCNILYTDPQNTSLAYLTGYNKVPWTTIRSRCDSILQS